MKAKLIILYIIILPPSIILALLLLLIILSYCTLFHLLLNSPSLFSPLRLLFLFSITVSIFLLSPSPPAGSDRLAQSDAMVVIGCPPLLIRSQLALGGLWRLPIIPSPTDQGLSPQRAGDRREGKGWRLILFLRSPSPPLVGSPATLPP